MFIYLFIFYKPYCEICGIDIEKTGKNHKMCDKCCKEREKERLYKKNYL